MLEYLFWAWIIVAVILLIAEIFTATFYIACFAVGALAAALVAFFFPAAVAVQLGAFVIGSGIAIALTRTFADRVTGRQPEEFGANRLIGMRGIVVEPIDSRTGRGRVRVDREEWRADVTGGGSLAQGVMVEVLTVDGTHLVVQPAGENGGPPPPDRSHG